jgi:hypothetical protein
MSAPYLPSLTSSELTKLLLGDGTLTDREALLVERLGDALEEIDDLCDELDHALQEQLHGRGDA